MENLQDFKKLLMSVADGSIKTKFNIPSDQANRSISGELIEMLGTDKLSYRVIRDNPQIFTIIEEVLDQSLHKGLEEDPFFDKFADYKNLSLGDQNEFYAEDNSIMIVSDIADGIAKIRKNRLNVGTSFAIETRWKAVAIYEELDRLLAGRTDFDKIVEKAKTAFKRYIAEDVAIKFMGAGQHLPTQFKESGSPDPDSLHKVIEHVAATGKTPIITGTKSALRKIGIKDAATLFSDKMKDQYNETGHLGVWEGYSTFEIPQFHKRNTFDLAVNPNRILIIGTDTKPIKVVNEGESRITENKGLESASFTEEYGLFNKIGIDVVFDSLFGTYDIV